MHKQEELLWILLEMKDWIIFAIFEIKWIHIFWNIQKILIGDEPTVKSHVRKKYMLFNLFWKAKEHFYLNYDSFKVCVCLERNHAFVQKKPWKKLIFL